MKVTELRNESELQRLKTGWEALLRDSASDTVFLTWEWATAWWSIYASPDEFRMLAAFDGEGVLRGLVPFRRQTVRRFGLSFETIVFAGDTTNDSDYLDFIISAGYEKPVLEAFHAYWRQAMPRGTLLVLNEIPDRSPNLDILRDLAGSQKLLWKETAVPCASVHLPSRWEDYLGILKPRFRTKIRSVLRELESRPDVRFGFCETPEQVQRMLPVLFDLHTRRWGAEGKPGVFGWDRKRQFYSDLSPRMLERGWLRFSWLEWNGRILACQFGFAYREVYFLLQEGYEPASEHWHLGIGLRAWSIREFLKQGLREYDFLGGQLRRHRTDWGATLKQSKQIAMGDPTPKNLLFCHGPEREMQAREAIAKLLPATILSTRRAHLERRAAAAQNSQSEKPPNTDWLRNAAAYCYIHSMLPVAARSLRAQFRMSVSANGILPKVSWTRRTEPSARIFCFHRINDDNDEFFSSVSTELFEKTMQHVARNHKVVSLHGLMQHLEEGLQGAVIAITFDDGYRDNYQNAFPVLQRYGMPATIFLTTGGLDSGDPLWFEQLAHALKTSRREYLDLEIDLPRRFWLRTREERLDANGRIFSLLRSMSDVKRKNLLAGIFLTLDVDHSERRNQMLTWDQVRLLNANGIEFGGHTVTHPFLSMLTREQAHWEASECKRRIEEELQQPVKYFAYPNGRGEDFNEWNKEVIRSAGYQAAVTTIWGVNYRSTDPMALRRSGPWEENPDLFASKLDWYELVNG